MRVYRIATVYWNGECVTIFGGIDLGVIYILVYGEAGAGLQNSAVFWDIVGCVTDFGWNRLRCYLYTSIWGGGCGFTILISESRIIPKLSVFESEEKFCLWRGYVEVDIGFHEGKSMFAEAYTEIGRASLH